jgi:hypothetical protein
MLSSRIRAAIGYPLVRMMAAATHPTQSALITPKMLEGLSSEEGGRNNPSEAGGTGGCKPPLASPLPQL